ncbi:hypothetical protein cypCar_00024841, partial [Cyprinus carpio]
GLPRQICWNDCGIFMLMYTLSIVTSTGFQFQEMDMPLIRKWWCLLMERFKIDGYGQRFQPIFRVPRKCAITEKIPAHMQAVFDRTAEEKRLVDFIVHSPGAEQHLVNMMTYSSLQTRSK